MRYTNPRLLYFTRDVTLISSQQGSFSAVV